MVSVSNDGREYLLFRDASGNFTLDDAIAFKAFGLPIAIRTNDAHAVPLLLEHLPPSSNPTSDRPERMYTLHVTNHDNPPDREVASDGTQIPEIQDGRADRVMLAHTNKLTEALEIFESDLQLQVAEMCGDKVFVHAGVVGWRGRAMVLPGTSTAGKTTLIASLARAGATYYSDEYAVFDDEGRVHPYSKPLKVRAIAGESRIKCQPEMFGSSRGVEPLPVGLIVATQYRSGARWQPRKLSPGKAVLELIQNTVPMRRRPHSCLTTLCRIGSSAVAIQSARGEADEIAPLLLREMDEHTVEVPLGEIQVQCNATLGR